MPNLHFTSYQLHIFLYLAHVLWVFFIEFENGQKSSKGNSNLLWTLDEIGVSERKSSFEQLLEILTDVGQAMTRQ